MFFKSILVSAFLLILSVPLMAQTDSFITVKKSLLPQNVVQQVEQQNKIETYGKWVGLGKEVGTAVKEGLGALTSETEKFSKTGVGKFTMFIIAFKVLGYPIIQLVFGIIVWLFGTIISSIFFVNCFLPKRVLISNNKTEGKKWEYFDPLACDWEDSGGIGGGMAIFGAIYAVWCIICCGIIFIH